MTSTAVWLNWHFELNPDGSVSSDYPSQIQSEESYERGTEVFGEIRKYELFILNVITDCE